MDKSMLCVDQWQPNGTLATGSMDRTISLFDTREGTLPFFSPPLFSQLTCSATSLISLTLSTKSPVPSLKCHPTNSFTLANVTYAGNVQIWDVRSPKNALFDVRKAGGNAGGEKKRDVTERGKMLGERLLGMDWDGEVLVAGGEDGEVGIWRARGE
jgi:ribosome biogenesis protein YTM1